MLLYSRFIVCWCILYIADIAVDRLIRRSRDLALGHVLLPKDPGDTDPYLAGGIMLMVIGIIAGIVLALVYASAVMLLDSIPLLRKWSLPLKSVLISAILGILIYQVWNSYTHAIIFSYTVAIVGFMSGIVSGWFTARKKQYALQGR